MTARNPATSDGGAGGAITVVEYGLRAPDGTIYDGADEGLRWNREQVEYAQDVALGDVIIERTVTTFEPIISGWTDTTQEATR